MMQRSVLVVSIVVLTMALVLSGCAAPAPAPAPALAPAPVPAPSGQTAAPAPAPAAKPAPAAPATTKPIELRFAHYLAPAAYQSVNVLIPWAKKAEEATKGRVKITMYPSELLAKETDTVMAVESGIADIGWVTMAAIRGRFPLSEVTTLPFLGLAQGKDEKGNVMSPGKVNSLIYYELYESVPEIQAERSTTKILLITGTVPAFIETSKKPVRNLNDLKGLKIRTLAGLQTDALKLLGAVPIPIPGPEIYEAAQKGVIGGMAANVTQMQNFRLYEVLRYSSDINLGTTGMFSMMMNMGRWNSLPADIQQAIMSVSGRSGSEWAGEQGSGFDLFKAFEEEVKKGGFKRESVASDPGEAEKWQNIAGKPLWDKWIADMQAKGLPAKKAFDELRRITKKYE